MRLLTTTASLIIMMAVPAVAQIGNPAGMMPGTVQKEPGVPAPHQANTQDRLFARLIAAGGLAEVDTGKLAQQKGQNIGVKEFGQHMVQDHGKSNEQLASLAKQAGIPLPTEPDPEHKAKRAELEGLGGPQFDIAYMQTQVTDHQKAAV